MKRFKKISIVLTMLLVCVFAVEAMASSALKGKVVIMGSTALLPLSLEAAKEFKKLNPNVTIVASGGSSIVGPQSVRKGAAQIGACDWDATKDAPGFPAFDGMVAHPVAVIPFAAIVNKDVGVDNLTTEQLIGIFTGKITSWKEVGGKDEPITVINRAAGSGTRVNFELKALDGNGTSKGNNKNYKEVSSSGDMTKNVQTIKNAIGYCDLAYVKGDIKAIKINGVEPTVENIVDGKYNVWSYGYYLTKENPDAATKAFIEYIQSSKVQQSTVKKMKFIPLSAMKD